jgi:hypothetical protein
MRQFVSRVNVCGISNFQPLMRFVNGHGQHSPFPSGKLTRRNRAGMATVALDLR